MAEAVACGALRAFIVTGDNFRARAVTAQVGEAEPWSFLPFGKVAATALIAVDERRLLVVADRESQSDYQVALFDVVARERLGGVFDRWISARWLFVDRARKRLFLDNNRPFKAWSLQDFAELHAVDLPIMGRAGVGERNDGTIVLKGPETHEHPESPPHPVLLVVDAEGRVLERFGETVLKTPENDRPALRPTPGGRWLWRPHHDTVLATDADGRPVDPADLAEVSDEALFDRLAAIRVHGVLELWRAGPIVFDRRIVTRAATLLELMEGTSETPQERLRRGRGILNTLRLTLERAPHADWRPEDPALRSRMDPMETAVASYYRASVDKPLHGAIVDGDAADDTFLVDFGSVRRRVGIDGALGELEPTPPPIEAWTTIQDPDEPGRLKSIEHPLRAHGRAFLSEVSVPVFDLPDLGEAVCIAAIEAVSDRLAADPRSLAWGTRLTLTFRTPGRELSEAEFFAHVAATCPGAAPALRRLLATLDAAPLPGELYSDDMTGALGHAALALIQLDPAAYPCLDGFFERRDSDHEPFGTKHLLPALAVATGDFAGPQALRFAVRRLHEEQLGGCDNGWLLAPTILRGARASVTAEAFADIVREEGRALMGKFDLPNAVFLGAGSRLAAARAGIADQEDTAAFGLVEPLTNAADPGLDWDRRFVAILRRRPIRYRLPAATWARAWWRAEAYRAESDAANWRPHRPLSAALFRTLRALGVRL